MATRWNSQQGEGEYSLQFGTDNREKYRLVEKAAQMAIDGKTVDDVVEVKHGEWINVPPYRALSGEYLKGQECSVRHSFFVSEGNTPYSNHPYCCECGAKMDGGRKNDGKG